ncbi:MAG TPA: ATP-binding protein [Williamwhitmania sp.]|nr:ATP-binding protein [Williamwhitmania sp.]
MDNKKSLKSDFNYILIVEDSPSQAALLQYILEKGDYRSIIAQDGEEALALIRENKPLLVVSDIVMPKMDGYDLCKEIKSKDATKDIPVILITSLSDAKEVIHGLSSGANSFITKPFRELSFLTNVNKILSEENGQVQNTSPFSVEILFEGKKRFINSDQQSVINLLLNIYDGAVQQNAELVKTRDELRLLNERLESLVEERTQDLLAETKISQQIAEQLKESELIFNQFMEYSPVYVFFKDAQTRSLRLSKNYEQMLGRPINDLLGKTMDDLFPSEFAKKVVADDLKILRDGKPAMLEEKLNGKYYNTIKFPIYVENIPTYIAGFTIDITDHKLAEEEIKRKNEQLQIVNAEKDKFYSIIAHDLKSPFNSILGYLDMLTKNFRTYDIEKKEGMLGIINTSAQNTFSLLEDLLIWAQSQSGKISFEPKELEFSDIGLEVVENLKQTADKKSITINSSYGKGTVAFADADMLKIVLRNLISNAIKFTHKGGRIDIGATQRDSSLTISVTDSGVGIAPEILANLFNFSQTNTTIGTDNEGGTGLGLSLCKEFVEKHGGRIWAESEVNRGSSFYFTLPLRDRMD